MPGAAVSLVLMADEAASRRTAASLFPGVARCPLARADLRPAEPFRGPLFALLAGQPRGARVGLIVPVVVRVGGDGAAGGAGGAVTAPAFAAAIAAPASPPSGALFAVADHVNLELRGPLTGRWPAGVPRDFPSMTGVYQPADVRAAGGARVYSSGVVVAGVADARRLSPFESRAVRERGLFLVCDSLIPAAIVAAYYGLHLAACGVAQAPAHDRE